MMYIMQEKWYDDKMTNKKIILTDNISELKRYGITKLSAAIGIFDGVHAGHRLLLRNLTETAAELNTDPVVLTFSPHPREVLSPGILPNLLIPPEEKYHLLESCGVRAAVVIPFTPELARIPAEEFLLNCMNTGGIRLLSLCVGTRFRCGAGGKGTTDVLERFALEHGLRFRAVPELTLDGETVCSTAIRNAVASGDFEKALRFTGRMPQLSGYVEHGNGIAGTELRHPTANLHVEYGVLPPAGVYAGSAEEDGKRFFAAVNIGYSPTFSSEMTDPPFRVEIHLIDFEGDLYDRKMTVKLYKQIRPEQRFADAASLRTQILRDVNDIRTFFKKEVSDV